MVWCFWGYALEPEQVVPGWYVPQKRARQVEQAALECASSWAQSKLPAEPRRGEHPLDHEISLYVDHDCGVRAMTGASLYNGCWLGRRSVYHLGTFSVTSVVTDELFAVNSSAVGMYMHWCGA